MLFTDLSLAFNLHVNSSSASYSFSPTHLLPAKCSPSTLCEHSSTYSTVYAYSQDNYLFVKEFMSAFVKMVNIEYKYYRKGIESDVMNSAGRLGELLYFNETKCMAG